MAQEKRLEKAKEESRRASKILADLQLLLRAHSKKLRLVAKLKRKAENKGNKKRRRRKKNVNHTGNAPNKDDAPVEVLDGDTQSLLELNVEKELEIAGAAEISKTKDDEDNFEGDQTDGAESDDDFFLDIRQASSGDEAERSDFLAETRDPDKDLFPPNGSVRTDQNGRPFSGGSDFSTSRRLSKRASNASSRGHKRWKKRIKQVTPARPELLKFIRKHNLDAVRLCLEEHPKQYLGLSDSLGQIPLHKACILGTQEISYLIARVAPQIGDWARCAAALYRVE